MEVWDVYKKNVYEKCIWEKIYMRCDGYYTNTVRLKFRQKRVIKSNYFNNHIALNIKKLF